MDKYIQLIFDVINNVVTRINDESDLMLLVNNYCINEKGKDHILMNVIGINKVSLDISQADAYVMQGDSYILKQKPEYYQFLIAFHSMFADEKYLKGFEILSQISSFIDINKEFSVQNVPKILENNLEKFFFHAKSFTLEEEHMIWQKLKTAYMPTIYYEVGLIPLLSSVNFGQKKVAPLTDFKNTYPSKGIK